MLGGFILYDYRIKPLLHTYIYASAACLHRSRERTSSTLCLHIERARE
uniref:Uncharacterized protein n=1 Tax=Picea glauca TaxID=3330 RepID=A0A101M0P4_PICGL|nr:hypothetical protein ABT39_MTgene4210 [Picea glauca]